MNRAELRALRLAIIDGHVLTEEEAIIVVGTLEDIAAISEREFGPVDNVRSPAKSECGYQCPNEGAANGLWLALKRAGSLPGGR